MGRKKTRQKSGGTSATNVTTVSHKRAFEFTSSTMESKQTPLRRAGATSTTLVSPSVHFTPRAWDTMWAVIDMCQKEVGWFGLVEHESGSNVFLVTEIFVPEQEVTCAETDIDEAAMTELALELDTRGDDPSKLLFWGHSHVDMSVSPSKQDEDQVDEYLDNCPIFIRGIFNKKRAAKIDIYDVENEVVHNCVSYGVPTPGLTARQLATLKKHVNENVKEFTYVTPHFTGKRGNGWGGTYYGGAKASAPRTQRDTTIDDDDNNVLELNPDGAVWIHGVGWVDEEEWENAITGGNTNGTC